MRVFLASAVLILASCASNMETPALEKRITSWKGSSVHELASVLGEPTSVTDTSWEWRVTGPGMQATTSPSSLTHRVEARDRNSPVARMSSAGIDGKTWTQSADTSISRKECVYRARIDGVIIVEIEALAISGRCTFGEIPLRAKGSSLRQS